MKKSHNSSKIFAELQLFEIISLTIVSTLQLKNRQRYFNETGYENKLVSDNVQRTRTVTPPTIFVKLCLFEIFLRKSCPFCNFNTVMDIFMKLGTVENKNHNSCYVFYLQNNAPLELLVSKLNPLYRSLATMSKYDTISIHIAPYLFMDFAVREANIFLLAYCYDQDMFAV